MGITPKLKPNIIIQNKIRDELSFETTSALVLNSFFRYYEPQLVNTPDLTLSLTPTLQPALKKENNPNFNKPEKQYEFFNTPNVARGAEGLGDLISSFASGNFFDNVSPSMGMGNKEKDQHQTNPAAFFSIKNKLMPSPTNNKKTLDKKYEESLELRRNRQLKKDYEEELALRHRPKLKR